MKKILLAILFLALAFNSKSQASCPSGFTQISIVIVPDSWPQETHWNLTDINGIVLAAGDSIGDTVCVATNTCVVFTITDAYGDGIFAPGGYWVYADNNLVASGNSFGYIAKHPIGCPAGMFCSSPLTLNYGTFTAPFDDTFYTITPTVTGNYNLTTCGMNTCDTKIWIYQNCSGQLFDESPAGTYAYNDNSTCGLQANLNVILIAGQTYYVRIGDNLDDCPGTVDFTFSYVGPITGCIDPLACNFNPLATVDDGSCIYYPNPLCAGPDLRFDSTAFVNSLGLMTITASTCDVNEGCVTGYGTRYVISFTSKIDNIGTLDYYIGNPAANPNMFNTVNCHGHAHYEGYGDYRLYDASNNLIPVGHKNGFCVIDLCGIGQYNCGNMGISVNCYDIYGAGTQCQWVDITDVPDGQYRLAIIVNSHHLPDAMNHYEINNVNNAVQVCIQITRNAQGVPSFSVLPSCTQFVDCMGIPGGAAMLDCNGVCGGPSIFGNINGDLVLDSLDVLDYADMLENAPAVASTCNDLNGDGELTVYDAALALWCTKTPHHPHPAGSGFNDCNFPHNILNINDSTGLAISNVDFTAGYVDIELSTITADIKAYQFSMHGINITNVVSLSDPLEFPVYIRQMGITNEIFALSIQDSSLTRSNSPQLLCRIFFSSTNDTIICIQNIKEIINQNYERTVPHIYGSCRSTSTTGINNIQNQIAIALIPNPVTNLAYLQLSNNVTPDKVEIIDMTGRVTQVAILAKNNSYQLDLSSYNSGLYIVRVKTGNQTGITRFLKL